MSKKDYRELSESEIDLKRLQIEELELSKADNEQKTNDYQNQLDEGIPLKKANLELVKLELEIKEKQKALEELKSDIKDNYPNRLIRFEVRKLNNNIRMTNANLKVLTKQVRESKEFTGISE